MRALAVCGCDRATLRSKVDIRLGGLTVRMALVEDVVTPKLDVDDPRSAESVLVRTRGFSLNFRDRRMIVTTAMTVAPHEAVPIGSEMVGDVIACGRAVDRCKPGDRVIFNAGWGNMAAPTERSRRLPTNGASCEFGIYHQQSLVPIPSSLPDEHAASFSINAQTAYAMVRAASIEPGDRVLVTAARSNLSLIVLQVLASLGPEVVATTTSNDHHVTLEKGNARIVRVPRGRSSFANVEELAEVATRGGFTVVIDPFLDLHLLRAEPVLAYGARYVTCGLAGEIAEQDALPVCGPLFRRELHLICNHLGDESDLLRALTDYQSGALRIYVDSVWGDGDETQFLHRCFSASDRLGKVILLYR